MDTLAFTLPSVNRVWIAHTCECECACCPSVFVSVCQTLWLTILFRVYENNLLIQIGGELVILLAYISGPKKSLIRATEWCDNVWSRCDLWVNIDLCDLWCIMLGCRFSTWQQRPFLGMSCSCTEPAACSWWHTRMPEGWLHDCRLAAGQRCMFEKVCNIYSSSSTCRFHHLILLSGDSNYL